MRNALASRRTDARCLTFVMRAALLLSCALPCFCHARRLAFVLRVAFLLSCTPSSTHTRSLACAFVDRFAESSWAHHLKGQLMGIGIERGTHRHGKTPERDTRNDNYIDRHSRMLHKRTRYTQTLRNECITCMQALVHLLTWQCELSAHPDRQLMLTAAGCR